MKTPKMKNGRTEIGRKLIGILLLLIMGFSCFYIPASSTGLVEPEVTEEAAPPVRTVQARDELTRLLAAYGSEYSYKRGRSFERWAFPDGTFHMVTYMGPRFVRHYQTGEFVELVFEDRYASEGYYLVQNAYIGMKIYDDRTVLYDPDMENVAVDDVRFTIQAYDNKTEVWKDLDLGTPKVRVDTHNSTAIIVTRVYDAPEGRLDVSYIIRDGELIKYNVIYKNLTKEMKQYRVVQSLQGIQGDELAYNSVEGKSEKLVLTTPIEIIAPCFEFRKEEKTVLGFYLQDIGSWSITGIRTNTSKRLWYSDILKGISLVPTDGKIMSQIFFGNFSLDLMESLTIDPFITTIAVVEGKDDTYVQHNEHELYGQIWYTYGGPCTSTNDLWFGRSNRTGTQGENVTESYRTYLRWPVYVPETSIIVSAFLNVSAAATKDYVFTSYIKALNFTDCPAFNEGTAEDIWNYDVMSATTTWQQNEWEKDEWYSVNVTQQVKDFIDLDDYTVGNYIGLRIDNGTAEPLYLHYRSIYSRNKGSAYAPRLSVTFVATSPEKFVEPISNWSFEDSTAWVTSASRTLNNTVYYHDKRSWYVEGSTTENAIIEQELRQEIVDYLKNRPRVSFGFWYKPDGVISEGQEEGKKNQAHAEIVFKVNGVEQDPIVGESAHPTDDQCWHQPIVSAEIPENLDAVKLRIVGERYQGTAFKGYVDLAVMSVDHHESVPTAFGDVDLVASIFYANRVPNLEWDGFVSLATSVTANATDASCIGKVSDLKVELLPNDGSMTSQEGRLMILSASQQNNLNAPVNNAKTIQQKTDTLISTANTAFTIAGFVCFFIAPVISPSWLETASALIEVEGGGTFVYDFLRPTIYDPVADGGDDFSAHTTFDYGYDDQQQKNASHTVRWVNVQDQVDWRFRTDTEDIFAIKISGNVEWYEWNEGDPENPDDDNWVKVDETTASNIISLADYWEPQLEGWDYRKEIAITGSTAGAQTDYPIKVKVHHGPGTDSAPDIYCNNHCKTDFGDIRFTKADGTTLLDYWIEKTDGDVATIWVEVDSIPASPGTSKIYMYYGNDAVSTTSNGPNTFLIFDDFNDASFNTILWNKTTVGTASITETGGYLKMSTNAYLDHCYIDSKPAYDFPDPTRTLLRVDIKKLTTQNDCHTLGVLRIDRSDGSTVAGSWYKSTGYDRYIRGITNSWWNGVNRHAYLGISRHEFIHSNDDEFTWAVEEGTYTWDDTKTVLDNYPITSTDRHLKINLGAYLNHEMWLDWVAVGKACDPEPYISDIGLEELT